jgi:hypothetical protein
VAVGGPSVGLTAPTAVVARVTGASERSAIGGTPAEELAQALRRIEAEHALCGARADVEGAEGAQRDGFAPFERGVDLLERDLQELVDQGAVLTGAPCTRRTSSGFSMWSSITCLLVSLRPGSPFLLEPAVLWPVAL